MTFYYTQYGTQASDMPLYSSIHGTQGAGLGGVSDSRDPVGRMAAASSPGDAGRIAVTSSRVPVPGVEKRSHGEEREEGEEGEGGREDGRQNGEESL